MGPQKCLSKKSQLYITLNRETEAGKKTFPRVKNWFDLFFDIAVTVTEFWYLKIYTVCWASLVLEGFP